MKRISISCYIYALCYLCLFRLTIQQTPPCSFTKNSISTSWDLDRFPSCNAVGSVIEGLLQYGQGNTIPCVNGTSLGDCYLTVDGCPYQCLVRLGSRASDSQTLRMRLEEPLPGLFSGTPVFQFEALVLPQVINNWRLVVGEQVRAEYQEPVVFDPLFLTNSKSLETLYILIPTIKSADLIEGSLPSQLQSLTITQGNLTGVPNGIKNTRIKDLNVSTNHIQTFDSNSMRTLLTLSNLQVVDFSNNELDSFPRLLLYLPVLKNIYLKNNKISSVELTSEECMRLEQLERLELEPLRDGVDKVECSASATERTVTIKSGENYVVCVDDSLPPALSLVEGDADDDNDDLKEGDDEDGASNGSNTGTIVGTVVGSLLLLVLLAFLVLWYRKRSRRFRPRFALSPMGSPMDYQASFVLENETNVSFQSNKTDVTNNSASNRS